VQTEGAGDIPREAGDAESHISGVPKLHKQRRNDAEDESGYRRAIL